MKEHRGLPFSSGRGMCYAPPGNSQTWWTEAHAAWDEAYALILILAVDSVLAYFALRERREARKESAEERQARQEERWQRSELQLERQRADENKMRNDVTCRAASIHRLLRINSAFEMASEMAHSRAGQGLVPTSFSFLAAGIVVANRIAYFRCSSI